MLLWQAGEQSRTVFFDRLPMPNGFRSTSMSPAERLDEVARLLRLRARRQAEKANNPNHLRAFGLDFVAEGSVCDTDTHADRERS
jgi:hypothetical protein